MNASRNDGGAPPEAHLPRDPSTPPAASRTTSTRGRGARSPSGIRVRWRLRVGKSGTALSLAFHLALFALLIANAPTSIADETPTPIAEPIRLRLAGTVSPRPIDRPERPAPAEELPLRQELETPEIAPAPFPPEEIPPQDRVERRTPIVTPIPPAARALISDADWEATIRSERPASENPALDPPIGESPAEESAPAAADLSPPVTEVEPPPGSGGSDAATTTDAELSPEHRLEPDYPRSCIRLGHEGTVEFELSIAADGSVTAARITASSGCDALDLSAERTALRLRYSPATRDGVAVASVTTWRVQFRLAD